MEIWVEIIFEGAFLSQIHLLYALDYKPLLNTGHTYIENKEMVFKKWVKNIEIAVWYGLRTKVA